MGLCTSLGTSWQPRWAETGRTHVTRTHAPWPLQPPLPQEQLLSALLLGCIYLQQSHKQTSCQGPQVGACALTPAAPHSPAQCSGIFWSEDLGSLRTDDAGTPHLSSGLHDPFGTPAPPLQSTCTFLLSPAPVPCMISGLVACGRWRSGEETPQRPRAPPLGLLPACSWPCWEMRLGDPWGCSPLGRTEVSRLTWAAWTPEDPAPLQGEAESPRLRLQLVDPPPSVQQGCLYGWELGGTSS